MRPRLRPGSREGMNAASGTARAPDRPGKWDGPENNSTPARPPAPVSPAVTSPWRSGNRRRQSRAPRHAARTPKTPLDTAAGSIPVLVLQAPGRHVTAPGAAPRAAEGRGGAAVQGAPGQVRVAADHR